MIVFFFLIKTGCISEQKSKILIIDHLGTCYRTKKME